MKSIIHFICTPDPRIGYGVCALNLKKELEHTMDNNLFQIIVSDPTDNIRFNQICAKLNSNKAKFNFINIHLTHCLSKDLLDMNLPGYKVLYTLFEADRLPLGTREVANKYDLVLTPSKWGADVLSTEISPQKVGVAPLGVDPKVFHSWDRNYKREDKSIFTFLAVGKYEDRKSYQEIIEAFELSFPKESKYRLLLKLDNFFLTNTYEQATKLIKKERSHQIIILKNQSSHNFLKVEDMAQLFRSADCFLFPSKAEGWGLPLIEAISCGTPYIAVNYSGQSEYLKYCKQLYSEVKYTKELIKDKFFLHFNKFDKDKDVSWAKPEIKDLANKMNLISNNWEVVKEQALLNAEIIHKEFSWKISAEKLINIVLKKLIPKI